MTSYTVVLVEDEEYLRKELAQTTPWEKVRLRLIGEAGDGVEGEKLLMRLRPDLVLTDIRLPGQDGLSMLERALPRHVIVFSGHSDAHVMQQAIRIGVDDYLFKPIDDDELLASLEKTVRTLDAEGSAAAQAAGARGDNASPLPDLPRAFGRRHVNDAVRFVEENFGSAVGLQEAAASLGLSEHYLSRLFHATTGYSFMSYLTLFRMRKALELLGNPRLNITEVYTMCGFHTGSYFARIFRRYLGVSPAEYRDRGS